MHKRFDNQYTLSLVFKYHCVGIDQIKKIPVIRSSRHWNKFAQI